MRSQEDVSMRSRIVIVVGLLIICPIIAQVVTRTNDVMWVTWTNVPGAVTVEASTDLTNWVPILTIRNHVTNRFETVEYCVKGPMNRYEFWRLRND